MTQSSAYFTFLLFKNFVTPKRSLFSLLIKLIISSKQLPKKTQFHVCFFTCTFTSNETCQEWWVEFYVKPQVMNSFMRFFFCNFNALVFFMWLYCGWKIMSVKYLISIEFSSSIRRMTFENTIAALINLSITGNHWWVIRFCKII